MDEVAIQTAGFSSRVVRVGQTVRRPVHKNTAVVHALLEHLERTGFESAPRALGIDHQGRDVVSYISGTAGHYPLKPYVLSESTLIRLGLLLRRFHDATVCFSLPTDLVWQNTVSGTSEVICHGDAGPYNIIFRKGAPIGLIDFERATPGPRVWDIAFVLYRFAPLCDLRGQVLTPSFLRQTARRIRIFLHAYGFSQKDDLFIWIQLRLKSEIDLFETGGTDDLMERQEKIEAGHLDLYKRDLHLIEEVSGDLRALI
ncbi:MAG TPA: aminoglycoside phosphotransferase family protein [Chthoniobacterales bacterium]